MTPNISTTTATTKTKPINTPTTNATIVIKPVEDAATNATIVIKPVEDAALNSSSALSAGYVTPLLQLDHYILNHLNEIFQNEVFNPYFLMKISCIKQKYTKVAEVNQSVFAAYVKALLDLLEEINIEYFEKIPNFKEYLLCQRHYMKLINKCKDTGSTSTSFKRNLITDHIDILRDFHESEHNASAVSQRIQSQIIIPSLLNENHDSISTNKLFKEFMQEKFLITDISVNNLNQNTELLDEFEAYHRKQIQDDSVETSKNVLKFFDF